MNTYLLHRSVISGATAGMLLAAAFGAAANTETVPGKGKMTEVPAADVPTGKVKIYKYLSEGTTSFSDRPPRSGAYVVLSASCYACSLTSNINWQSTRLHLEEYAEVIDDAARQFGLDSALVRAIIHAESGFNAGARSQKGAMGLMQLMPGTARMVGVTDALAPNQNIRGGTRYLANLMMRFKSDVRLATAAYNAGPEAVKKYAGVPPYAETEVYVQRVQILHQRYKEALRG